MFWHPEKPKRIYTVDIVPENYVMQVKKDGWRIILDSRSGELKLFNRHGEPITCTDANKWNWITDIFGKGFYLDGEVIGRRQGEKIDTIVIWDILYYENSLLKDIPYIERYALLDQWKPDDSIIFFMKDDLKFYGTNFIAGENGMMLFISRNYSLANYYEVWNGINLDTKYNEGVVFKNPDSPLGWSMKATTKTVNQLKLKARD